MYRFLLCSRYLRTRYIALASIISVMLGVATMIVVNSVMAGFRTEMHDRLHGILSDITFESYAQEGLVDPDAHMREISRIIGPDLKGMTPTVHTLGLVNIPFNGSFQTRPVKVIGIDPETYAKVGDFSQYMQHPENRKQLQFMLRETGYDDRLSDSGWEYRREKAEYDKIWQGQQAQYQRLQAESEGLSIAEDPVSAIPADPHALQQEDIDTFDPAVEQNPGAVFGIALCAFPRRDSEGNMSELFICKPGDDITLTVTTAGQPPKRSSASFTIVDFYESGMSEYDASFVFVPIDKLQQMRGMSGAVTSIQIKLREGANLDGVRDRLRAAFPVAKYGYHIQTWRDMQGPLLSAVQLETTILNILLFMIIAVAGFGILATFYMIVVEKTRDVGILKSLGAPSSGVMSIFLAYGLSLGITGSGVGMVLGLLFVHYINSIADFLERITGQKVFDETVYYFSEIPTIVDPLTVTWIVGGAVGIAVLASVLPAMRAARLHCVEALRYE